MDFIGYCKDVKDGFFLGRHLVDVLREAHKAGYDWRTIDQQDSPFRTQVEVPRQLTRIEKIALNLGLLSKPVGAYRALTQTAPKRESSDAYST